MGNVRYDTLKDYSEVSGVGVRVIDENNVELFSTPRYDQTRQALDSLARALKAERRMATIFVKSGAHALKYGGLYVFLCPLGLTYITSPITRDDESTRFVVAGPMILSSREDYLEFEILPQVDKADLWKIKDYVNDIPVLDASTITPLSEQLFVNTVFLSGGHAAGTTFDDEIAEVPAHDEASGEKNLAGFRVRPYMFKDKAEAAEQFRLSQTLQEYGDDEARELLNEIRDQVLFRPHNNIDYIKGKAMEYVLTLYRSAIKEGLDVKTVIQLKNRAALEVDELATFDDVVAWLNNINDEFSIHAFRKMNTRHAEVIRRSLAYVYDHYTEKITLDDVAAYVSFSPSYLCSLFKDETGQNFKSCLNRVRIEKSKELMEDSSMSIADIGYAVGFTDQSYYARVFKQYEGVSPYHFRLTCKAEA